MAERGKERALRIKWEDREDLPTTFANQLIVSHSTGSEFYLVFGELVPPMRAEEVSEIVVRPVARVAVSAHNMERMVSILQQNLQRWMDGVRRAQEEANAKPTH